MNGLFPRSHRHRVSLLLLILCLALSCCTTPPPTPVSTQPELVELVKVIPDIKLDIRYATPNNFTGKTVYPVARCFLVKDAALALAKVQADLHKEGYGLKVFDGYRPLSVQRAFWAILPDPRYVADPSKGSRHNRGYAIDLTLVDANGNDVPMPTEYDDFTERAHRDHMDLPKEVIANRARLEKAMKRHGFIPFPTEWWHFDFDGYEDKP
ncbi:MAG: D-alanyl-D-alanine dipeptidase, partial [Candidatus Hydrogenedentes bacterium]|nr:D-alanyl-D-alanine dipeptidase [Candidatus Hydrogenedentota bacterium]